MYVSFIMICVKTSNGELVKHSDSQQAARRAIVTINSYFSLLLYIYLTTKQIRRFQLMDNEPLYVFFYVTYMLVDLKNVFH